jgi:hypothetical protein
MKLRLLCPLALLAAIALTAGLASAQSPSKLPEEDSPIVERNCGTESPTAEQMWDVGASLKRYVDEFGAQAVGGQIKVAFHVIYTGSEGNIPQSQIDAQIAELNKAYSGFYGGVNTGYTFVLASVSRTNSSRWFKMTPGSGAERQAKQSLATDIIHRLNVYTCKPGQNLLGWAYFPNSYPEGDWHHGVVFHYGSVPGGYLAPYNLGGTLDHEAGHYLGLYHTFQGGCTPPGDQVSDTPDEATPTAGCPSGKDTCPTAGLDPIHNYMDYSDDACYTTFTAGQDARMDAMVPTYRPHLLNAAVAQAVSKPGAADPDRLGGLTSAVSFRGAAPNPFSKVTTLTFALPRTDHVSLKVYNVAGQLVETLMERDAQAGNHTVDFQAGNLPAGMYFAALRVGTGRLISKSIILVR